MSRDTELPDRSSRRGAVAPGAADALGEVFRLPPMYAVGLAAALRWFGLVPPVDGTFMTTVDTVVRPRSR